MIDLTSCLLNTIAKKGSIQDEYFLLQESHV